MFITFEGIDGSGKSTQFRRVADYLEQQGRTVCCSREPGGTRIGDKVRAILHDVAHTEMTAQAEILLYSASRAQLVCEVILPALEKGEIVLCDRYVESTYAYQGYGRQLDFNSLQNLTELATQGLKPDLIIYLDIDIELGLQRKFEAQSKGEALNRMDKLERAFYQRVRAGYLAMAERDPSRWFVVEASRPVEQVYQTIRQEIDHKILG